MSATTVDSIDSPLDPPRPWQLTVDQLLDRRAAGFDLVRLILAWLVLVSHTWPLGGFGAEPGSPLSPKTMTLGGFAVGGFFALSGLMVARSSIRRDFASFTRARIVRVMPGVWAAILFSAFAAGWIGWQYQHQRLSSYLTLDAQGPFAYVARGALLPVDFSHGVHDVFAHNPYGPVIGGSSLNGSLWTLPYEMRCYLLCGLVALIARRWSPRWTFTIAWAVTAALVLGMWRREGFTAFVLEPYADKTMLTFAFIFMTGALVAVWGDRIRVFGVLTGVALVAGVWFSQRSIFYAEHARAVLVLLLCPIAVLLTPVGRWLRGIDLSYGVYLYAWPVQQLAAQRGWGSGPWSFIAVCTVLTVACAAASWFLIERPAQRRFR